jgi:hypothetical protein
MSHFLTVVLVPKSLFVTATASGFTDESVNAMVSDLLAPFDENLSVPEYEETCYCVGRLAREEAGAATEQADPLQGYRDAFNAQYKAEVTADDDDVIQSLWRDFTKPYFDAREANVRAHPWYNEPARDCDECHGTGKRMTDRNPQSKWDWWTVGGRYDGCLYDDDGRPSGDGGFNFGDEHHQPEYNMRLVADLLSEKRFRAFAVLTPDGVWHERGKMGWWGVVSDATPRIEWVQEVENLYAAHVDHLAVCCDLHI